MTTPQNTTSYRECHIHRTVEQNPSAAIKAWRSFSEVWPVGIFGPVPLAVATLIVRLLSLPGGLGRWGGFFPPALAELFASLLPLLESSGACKVLPPAPALLRSAFVPSLPSLLP